MSVYVDNARLPYRTMLMCHMIADTHEELLLMARELKLSVRWLQFGGTWREHFDISLGKREEAIKLGAQEITGRELIFKLKLRTTPTGKVSSTKDN